MSNQIQNQNAKKIYFAVIAIIILIAGSFWLWKKTNIAKQPTLQEAGKMGELATNKLMVQIENPKGNAEDIKGRYERGDIVLIMPADHQFSPAEKEGFLILQMDITPSQAQILTQSLQEQKMDSTSSPLKAFWQNIINSNEPGKNLKRRKFTVDLAKIGIVPNDQKGREIEDKIFSWDIITEKQ